MNEQKPSWTLSTLAAHLLITNYLIYSDCLSSLPSGLFELCIESLRLNLLEL